MLGTLGPMAPALSYVLLPTPLTLLGKRCHCPPRCSHSLPLDAILGFFLDQPDTFQHVGNVVNPPLLAHSKGVSCLADRTESRILSPTLRCPPSYLETWSGSDLKKG